MKIQLREYEWETGQAIGVGGFGAVFEAYTTDGSYPNAVIKMVSKAPGTEREMLFVDLQDAQNVIPILDSGETEDRWVLAMSRADRSLAQHLADASSPLSETEVVSILTDIAVSLSSINGRVVHRDIKPQNILLLDGRWCLADFGISRYADATTAPDTLKGALSPAYAAPERWRHERASAASDVYAWGVVAFQLLNGVLPFLGSADDNTLRDQHLHDAVPALNRGSHPLQSVVRECLNKAAEARPTPTDLLRRLQRLPSVPGGGGLGRLQEAQLREVDRLSESARQQSLVQSERQRRRELLSVAESQWKEISQEISSAIADVAPSAVIVQDDLGGLVVRLNQSTLTIGPPDRIQEQPWGRWKPDQMDVISACTISVRQPMNYHHYEGRQHSLWYCRRNADESYGWFELAFMDNPIMADRNRSVVPFSFAPSEEAGKAFSRGIMEFQFARSPARLIIGELEEFIDRWAGWLADAAMGNLHHPAYLPES